MGLFSKRKKKSSSIAKERLTLVLTYDRASTSSNDELMRLIKRDFLRVISQYIDIDDEEMALDIKTAQTDTDCVTSELVANIPIKGVKKLPKNTP